MTHIVSRQQNTDCSTAISRELADHLQRMELAAQVAKVGIQELSEIYTYSEYKTINSLVAADLYRKAFVDGGGKLTPAEERAYVAMRQQYLEHMEQISRLAGMQVLRDMVDAPRTLASRSFLDMLFGD